MESVPLRLNPQIGGNFLKNYWWAILIVVVVIVAVTFFLMKGGNNSNSNTSTSTTTSTSGSSVNISKKTVDGEEVWFKTVDGEEVPLTEEDKKQIAVYEEAAANAIADSKIATTLAMKQAEEAQQLSQIAMEQAMAASKAGTDLASQTVA